MGLPIVFLHAKHVARFLELRMNKTDKNDARGIAEYMQKGHCSIVNVKSLVPHRNSICTVLSRFFPMGFGMRVQKADATNATPITFKRF
jgi:hypothetical protein